MARIYVTPELGEAIKSIRMQNKITGTSVAEHINKSSTFITRLESATIETIDEKDLWKIFDFISQDNKDHNETIEKIYETLKIKYSPEEIRKQVWFENFDTVIRQIPIPEKLIDEINERIREAGIEPMYLLRRINSNESLTEEERNDNHPYNKWWAKDDAPTNATSIKIKLEESDFINILSKKKDTAPYIYLLSISYYLIKIERFGELVELESDEDNSAIMNAAHNLLCKHKFFSLIIREQLLSSVKSQEEYDELLSEFEIENINVIKNIVTALRFYSDKNIRFANEQLHRIEANLDWDMGFVLKLASLNFESLSKVSYACKQELIKKIINLIDEISEMPDSEKTIDTY